MSPSKTSFARTRTSRLALLFAVPIAMATLLVEREASAAVSGPISGWQKGTEPTWVSMYEYVPATLKPNAPILVIVHYCSGNAAGIMNQATKGGMVAAADQFGFLLVVPQTSRNCWDVATTPSLTHNGGGDTGAVVHQVEYAISTHGSNPERVYVTGTSSVAMMVEALLATYPDVFKAGAEFAGVPAGCWSVNNPDGQWSGPCAGGQVMHTAAEWGDMARAMYPGYTGFRPRIQLWHGAADTTISPANQTEAIEQWTNVFGFTAAATTTTDVTIAGKGYKREEWKDACGTTVLDAWTEPNGPHGTSANMTAEYSLPFFGLHSQEAVDAPVDAQVAACASAGGSGGMPASGGMGAVGGTDASGGLPATGGTAPGTGGTAPGTGGNYTPSPAAPVPSLPGCSCDVAGGSATGSAFAWAGVLALMFGLRRRAKRTSDSR